MYYAATVSVSATMHSVRCVSKAIGSIEGVDIPRENGRKNARMLEL
jgi:hypothetical protein